MIRVKYFASLRERMSRGEDLVEVSGDQLTLADVLARLTLPDGQTLQQLSLAETMMLSVNHEMVDIDHVVKDGDEIGIFPPVTGG
jgi:molybdopterin synthase sulfur carrier subunit